MGPKPDTHHGPRRPRPSYGSTIDPPNSNPEYGDARRPPVPPGYMNSQGPSYSNAHSNYNPYQSNASPYVPPPPRDASYHYGNYATNAHPPPPPSIAYSNSGNSSTESSRHSHNHTETSLAPNATLIQSTSSPTVPVLVNVHFHGDMHGHAAQPTHRHYQNDSEYHRSEQDPRRPRKQKLKEGTSHEEEDDPEGWRDPRAHRHGREEYALWNPDASPEPFRRPSESTHPPYPRSEQASYYKDARDNHYDRASFGYNQESQPPDGHIAEMHRAKPRPQRMGSTYSSASSSSHNAYNADPHQTLPNSHDTPVWSQDTYGKSEETLHGSPDKRPLRKPRRPSEDSSSTDSSQTVRPSYPGRPSQPSGSASTSSAHPTSADGRMSDRHHGYGYSGVDATYENPSQFYRTPSGQNNSIDFAGKPVYENNTRAPFISVDRTPTGSFAFSGDPHSQWPAEQDWHRRPDSSQQPPLQFNSSNAMGPATPQHTSRHPPSIRIPGPSTHGPYTVMPIIPENPNINELSHHMSRTSISESSYGRDHATYSSPPPSAHSISTLADKLTCLGDPCLMPIQRQKPKRLSFRVSSSHSLEGHVPLYMASKIIDQDSMPLWYPSPNLRAPDQTMRGIEVGDIGYLDDAGEFHTIFNIFHSHQGNIERGAHPPPEDHFNHLPYNNNMVRQTEIQKRHYFASSNIQRENVQSDGHYFFSLERNVKSKSNGAICVLPHGGLSKSLRSIFFNFPHVQEYFKSNAASWYQHAQSENIPDLLNGTLLFVKGIHMAKTWGIAAFKSKTRRNETKGIEFIRGNINKYQYRWNRYQEGWNTRAGPTLEELQHRVQLESNQCIGIIASSVHLDDQTWQVYFERPGGAHRSHGLQRLLSRASSMSSIFNVGRQTPH